MFLLTDGKKDMIDALAQYTANGIDLRTQNCKRILQSRVFEG